MQNWEPRFAELTNQATPNWVLRTLADAERAHIIATLRRTDGVVGGPHGAAAKLGLKRTTLIAKMRNLGISKETAKRGTGSLNSYRDRARGSFAVPASA